MRFLPIIKKFVNKSFYVFVSRGHVSLHGVTLQIVTHLTGKIKPKKLEAMDGNVKANLAE